MAEARRIIYVRRSFGRERFSGAGFSSAPVVVVVGPSWTIGSSSRLLRSTKRLEFVFNADHVGRLSFFETVAAKIIDILLWRFDIGVGDGPGDATFVEQVDSGDIGVYEGRTLSKDIEKVGVGVTRESRLDNLAIDSRLFLCSRSFLDVNTWRWRSSKRSTVSILRLESVFFWSRPETGRRLASLSFPNEAERLIQASGACPLGKASSSDVSLVFKPAFSSAST